jgi:hypothetical protein
MTTAQLKLIAPLVRLQEKKKENQRNHNKRNTNGPGMKHPESKLQSECVRWFRHQYPHTIIAAIPNGGARDVITGAILKREGVVPGFPDLIVCKKDSSCGVLFVEMKTATGGLSQNQKIVHAKLLQAGYCVAVCKSFDQFKETISQYMNQ